MGWARKRTAELLEAMRPDDPAGRWVDRFLIVLIVANVAAITLETVPAIGDAYRVWFQAFEAFSVAVFSVEYLLRLWSCVELPSPRRAGQQQTRRGFAVSPLGLIDLLAIAPFYLQLLLPEAATSLLMLRVFRALRLLRVLKLSRYSPALNVLYAVLRREARALGVATVIIIMMLVTMSWGIYLMEHQAQPAVFGTIPDALWWSVVTLTTVGYGDVVPVTTGGKVFAGCVALLGIGMVALPSAILVSGFSREVRRRSYTYHRAVELALSDDALSAHEASSLRTLREELGISPDDARLVESSVRRAAAGLDRCPHCGRSLDHANMDSEPQG